MVDVGTLINRLENDGEEEIQKRLLDSIYDPKPQTKRIVGGWLLSKGNERSEKRMNEHLAISMSAKRAAGVTSYRCTYQCSICNCCMELVRRRCENVYSE